MFIDLVAPHTRTLSLSLSLGYPGVRVRVNESVSERVSESVSEQMS